jgi:hypothetical protein
MERLESTNTKFWWRFTKTGIAGFHHLLPTAVFNHYLMCQIKGHIELGDSFTDSLTHSKNVTFPDVINHPI